MPHLALADIELDPDNARQRPSDITDMTNSVAASGVLQPIVVKKMPDDHKVKYRVCWGSRRYRAANALGHKTIPAVFDTDVLDPDLAADPAAMLAAQATENMQREPMEPIDQWRTMRRLVDLGWTPERAAQHLGISEREARKLDRLGALHPAILSLVEECGLPPNHVLAVLALAPLEMQARAAKDKTVVGFEGKGKAKVRTVSWGQLEQLCRQTSISQKTARFDVEAEPGVAWQEDMLAEPGSDGQWTTRDVKGFVDAQTRWLTTEVNRLKAAGWSVALSSWKRAGDNGYGAIEVPAGYAHLHETLYGNLSKIPANGEDDRYLLLAVDETPHRLGKIAAAIARPKARKKPAPSAQPDAGGDAAPPPAPTPAKRILDKTGLALVAEAKNSALHERIADLQSPHEMLALLVLALGADNVRIVGSALGASNVGDLAAKVLDPRGEGFASDDDILAAARTALARMLTIAPELDRTAGFSAQRDHHGSGAPAEWVGFLVDADTALPRFDTPEVLATVAGDTLRYHASIVGVKATKVSTLREMLAGKLPNFCPARFRRPPAAETGE